MRVRRWGLTKDLDGLGSGVRTTGVKHGNMPIPASAILLPG